MFAALGCPCPCPSQQHPGLLQKHQLLPRGQCQTVLPRTLKIEAMELFSWKQRHLLQVRGPWGENTLWLPVAGVLERLVHPGPPRSYQGIPFVHKGPRASFIPSVVILVSLQHHKPPGKRAAWHSLCLNFTQGTKRRLVSPGLNCLEIELCPWQSPCLKASTSEGALSLRTSLPTAGARATIPPSTHGILPELYVASSRTFSLWLWHSPLFLRGYWGSCVWWVSVLHVAQLTASATSVHPRLLLWLCHQQDVSMSSLSDPPLLVGPWLPSHGKKVKPLGMTGLATIWSVEVSSTGRLPSQAPSVSTLPSGISVLLPRAGSGIRALTPWSLQEAQRETSEQLNQDKMFSCVLKD